jgi:hypothetical protein
VRGGAITCHNSTTPVLRDLLAKGELVEFDDQAVGHWMAGDFDLAAEPARMSGGQR